MAEIIFKYFPGITDLQKEQFIALQKIYTSWNSKINVISRKDMDNFYVRHVLHSLAIAVIFKFSEKDSVLDVGTGGGFPGIPLAILFPRTRFVLLDSIQKKIRVVTEVVNELGLQNAEPVRARVEEHRGSYDFIISRAVTSFPGFVAMTRNRLREKNNRGGIICLKGGELHEEVAPFRGRVRLVDISEFFEEPFFGTKKIIFLPAGS